MAYSVHLRVQADLLGVARVIRVLRRYTASAAEVAFERRRGHEVAHLRGTLVQRGKAAGLAEALMRTPAVSHAVIFDGSHVLAEFSRP